MILVELLEVGEDILLDILDKRVRLPELVEPLLQFLPVAIAIDDEVELDVIVGGAQAEAATVKLELPRIASSTPAVAV